MKKRKGKQRKNDASKSGKLSIKSSQIIKQQGLKRNYGWLFGFGIFFLEKFLLEVRKIAQKTKKLLCRLDLGATCSTEYHQKGTMLRVFLEHL